MTNLCQLFSDYNKIKASKYVNPQSTGTCAVRENIYSNSLRLDYRFASRHVTKICAWQTSNKGISVCTMYRRIYVD